MASNTCWCDVWCEVVHLTRLIFCFLCVCVCVLVVLDVHAVKFLCLFWSGTSLAPGTGESLSDRIMPRLLLAPPRCRCGRTQRCSRTECLLHAPCILLIPPEPRCVEMFTRHCIRMNCCPFAVFSATTTHDNATVPEGLHL